MRNKLNLFALAVGTVVLLTACTSGGSGDLTGKEWHLTAITEKVPAFQGVIPAAEQANYTITFATDGTYHGAADCNQMGGTYKTSGSNAITITPGLSTRAFCPEGSFGDLYVHGLSRAKSWAVASGTLTLTLTDEGTMTFVVGVAAPSAAASTGAAATATPKPTAKPTAKPTTAPPAATVAPSTAPGASVAPTPVPVPGLTGKVWQLTTVTEKTPAFQGVVPADQQANYTIEFKADGSFTVKADCNTGAGTFVTPDPAAASGALTITVGVLTAAACPEGSMADLYLLGLSNSASYTVASGALTITLVDQGTLVFK